MESSFKVNIYTDVVLVQNTWSNKNFWVSGSVWSREKFVNNFNKRWLPVKLDETQSEE